MQDHCQASYNAAKGEPADPIKKKSEIPPIFPDAVVLMCYFHVVLNIKKMLIRKFQIGY